MRIRGSRAGWLRYALVCGWMAGCSTTPSSREADAPVGQLDNVETSGPIKVTLRSNEFRARRGEPIRFEVQIENIAHEPIWLPKEPAIVLVWIYPNGRKDNTMTPISDRVSSGLDKVQQLRPGEQIVRQMTVSTRYFPQEGVSKFQAIVQVPTNMVEPALPAGRFASNRFGVFVGD